MLDGWTYTLVFESKELMKEKLNFVKETYGYI